MKNYTFSRRLLPALLLASLALTSCERSKDQDPRPKRKCGASKPTTPNPGGNS